MSQHELDIKYMDNGVVKTDLTLATDSAFVRIYSEGLWKGHPIVSIEWTHKGETNKLIFGD